MAPHHAEVVDARRDLAAELPGQVQKRPCEPRLHRQAGVLGLLLESLHPRWQRLRQQQRHIGYLAGEGLVGAGGSASCIAVAARLSTYGRHRNA